MYLFTPSTGTYHLAELSSSNGANTEESPTRPCKRLALARDWLPVYARADRVLEQMINVFPDSDINSLIFFRPDEQG